MSLKYTPAFYLLGLTLGHAQSLRNGEDLLRAMHNRSRDSWYQTVTFAVKDTVYLRLPGRETSIDTGYEAMELPGKVRMDEEPLSAGKGDVFGEGTETIIDDNKIFATVKNTPMVWVLGFEVYRRGPAKTAKIVRDQGYDLSKIREDTWEGTPVYVVGAEKGDLKSNQFWVAKDRLLLSREIAPLPGKDPLLDDIRFTHYEPLAGAWIATEMQVYARGTKVLSVEYSDFRANVKLDLGTFDPERFATTHWEK